MTAARFGDAMFLGPQGEQAQHLMPSGVRWIDTPPLQGIKDYNRIVLRELVPHVRTSHVLIVQWDGFITHPELWRPDFLSMDYIGPPWYHGGHPGMVGNGGFSLRSRRLLDALASMQDLDITEPEDMLICVQRRAELEQLHGIRFAPLEMAKDFGCEYGYYHPSFGFHGMHNFTHIFDEPTLTAWLASANAEIIKHKHARNLVKSLMVNRRASEAIQLLQLRSHHLGCSYDQCQLLLRAYAHRFRVFGL
ncbi:DUF5672 family protein [Malikia sp.]|uniref:DUF5672 family protein n=1 Tax=Malikia sp. TaxID=2070706 RepID=UPI002602FA88|nr:DUF5672 family protein [Malikia sp.]MDD2729345.1 DUF5672 family protein [Malikia sp.]